MHTVNTIQCVASTYLVHFFGGDLDCNPTDDAVGCRIDTTDGYLRVIDGTGGGAWAFVPNDATARVTSTPDNNHVSYIW